jgi:H+/Cl- antiporter ClcA
LINLPQRFSIVNIVWSKTNNLLALSMLAYVGIYTFHQNVDGLSNVTNDEWHSFWKMLPMFVIQIVLVFSGLVYMYFTIFSHQKTTKKMSKSLLIGLLLTVLFPLVILLGMGFNDISFGTPLFWMILITILVQKTFSLYLLFQSDSLSHQND